MRANDVQLRGSLSEGYTTYKLQMRLNFTPIALKVVYCKILSYDKAMIRYDLPLNNKPINTFIHGPVNLSKEG